MCFYLYLSKFYFAYGHWQKSGKVEWKLKPSLLNCQCIYSSTCFIVTSNIYCFLVFLLHTEVSPAKHVFSSSLKNFTYLSLDHAYSVLNLFQIFCACRSTWNLVSCSSAELPSSGSFIYDWELRFPSSDDSEFIWALLNLWDPKYYYRACADIQGNVTIVLYSCIYANSV